MQPTHQDLTKAMMPETTKQTCRHLSLDQIRSATQNFNKSLVIGCGGFGKVYKGYIDQASAATAVAIKRLKSKSNQGALEFQAEVETLSKLRHCNLVSLIGCCNEGREMILVYDYMSHGTLEERLHKSALPLTWLQRLKICIGAARGLDYLHTGTGTRQGVIHRDVKSSNILLDENLAAKISDFGLAKIGPTNQTCTCVSTMVKGTFGYMDPSYFYSGKLTRKSDVYSFGVVLLEVICGKRVHDSSFGEWGMAAWAQDRIREGKLNRITDSRIMDNISSNCLKQFADIACRCLRNPPSERPTMAEIIVRLERILHLQEKLAFSVTDGKFINKLRSFFPSRIQLKPNKWMAIAAASNETEAGDSRAEVAGQLIHFDASSFTMEDLMKANAFVIGKSPYWKAYRLIMESGKKLLLTRLKSDLLLEEDIVLEKVLALGKLCHPNILVPNAYYHSKHAQFFVNDYNELYGSVSSLLHASEGQSPKPLVWSTRMSIIVGITRGLVYLHTEEFIVHGYLTSGNVLLDRDYKPMISDVGLSLLLKDDFRFQDANMKTDIYNLGLIMLELLTRKSTKIGKEGMDLCTWVMSIPQEDSRAVIFDPQLKREKSDIKLELALTLQLAMACVSLDPDARPTADQVLQRLEKILAIALEKREKKKHLNLFSTGRARSTHKRSGELYPVNLRWKVEKKLSLSCSCSRAKRPLQCGRNQLWPTICPGPPSSLFKKNLCSPKAD